MVAVCFGETDRAMTRGLEGILLSRSLVKPATKKLYAHDKIHKTANRYLAFNCTSKLMTFTSSLTFPPVTPPYFREVCGFTTKIHKKSNIDATLHLKMKIRYKEL